MIIEPRARGFICTTAHPDGCSENVLGQIKVTKETAKLSNPPKRVLVIGASTGYGLASRITAAFGGGADTIGVFFEKPAPGKGKRTASAGWYNTAAFEQAAQEAGLMAKSINGDAFSHEIKQQTIDLIKQNWGGGVDLVVYSLASPRRIDPDTGEVYWSSLKTLGDPYTSKSIDLDTGVVSDVTIEPGTEEELSSTIKVMGGEDWALWMRALVEADVLAEGVKTVAYSYIGPKATHAIYRNGTIGQAKKHLEETSRSIQALLDGLHGQALISINKALVTQAAAAIPIVPLYTSMLYKVMKAAGTHEACIEQMIRLFSDRLYNNAEVPVDEAGFIRMDDWEMSEETQSAIQLGWSRVTTDNIMEEADMKGYQDAFLQLFGFKLDAIDYTKETEAVRPIPSLEKEA